jgi:hypothetical protein
VKGEDVHMQEEKAGQSLSIVKKSTIKKFSPQMIINNKGENEGIAAGSDNNQSLIGAGEAAIK